MEVILSSHFSTKNIPTKKKFPTLAKHHNIKLCSTAGCSSETRRAGWMLPKVAKSHCHHHHDCHDLTIFIAILDEKSMTPMARYLSSSVALADSQPRTSHGVEHGPAQHLEARGEEAGAEGRGLPPQREVGVEGRNPGRGWGGRRGNCEAHRCRLNIFHKAF